MFAIEDATVDKKRHSPKVRLGLLLTTILAVIGSTYAVNILASSSVEYGQGIYQIVACDSYVNVSLEPTATVNGASYVGSFLIRGLNVGDCAGTTIRLRLFSAGSESPLDLFATPSNTNVGNAVILSIASGATLSTALDDVTLVNPAGQNIEYGDSSQSIDYNENLAEFTISFSNPKALMSAVDSIVLESASS